MGIEQVWKPEDGKPLPEPNVMVPMSGDELRTEKQIGGILCNPIYAGLGPYPALVDDKTWVRSAARMIREEGPEQFLVNLLFVLRKTFQE